MQTLTDSVGQGGANKGHDAALVQCLLMRVQKPAVSIPMSAAYLTSYDGNAGPKTIAAIKEFQKDYVSAQGAATTMLAKSVPMFGSLLAAITPADMKDGLVVPGDATWNKLVALVPSAFQDMRVLVGGKTVYLGATQQQCDSSVADATSRTFNDVFRAKVILCIQKIFNTHGIVVRVNPNDGARRTFGEQDALLNSGRGVTNAGPGESNHNFGQAADLGFKGLRWIKSNGTVEENENPWLAKLSPGKGINAEAMLFWNVLRSSGIAVGLHRGPEADRPHLQSWSDAGVSMGRRLADLLTKSGSMQWSSTYSSAEKHFHYKTDMGLGGDQVDAGTASEIWNENASITLAQLQSAWNSQAGRTKTTAKTAKADDLTAMKKELRRQFELADANWQSWTPA
jgi:hypothetical protein